MAGLFDGTSLEQAVTCERCGQPLADCECPRDGQGGVCLPADQPARVQREKRRGKWVTVASGLDPNGSDLKGLLKQFKSKCSAGGAVRADGFEIQGDHRDRLVVALKAMGYPAKASGG